MERNRAIRAEQQRLRRTARRACGLCGERADMMRRWADQSIPICKTCSGAIESLRYRERHCAFNEVSPERLRPARGPLASSVSDVENCESVSTPTTGRGLLKWLWG